MAIIFINSKNNFSKIFNRIAVIVRFKQATKSQLERYTEWETLLSQFYDVWFIIDGESNNYKYKFKNKYYLTIKDIFNKYPKIKEFRLPGRCVHQNEPDDIFFMWVSHTESILMWYKYTNSVYDNVWIIEQDLGVTGNIYEILSYYEKNKKDIITYDVDISPAKDYPHIYCYSNEYLRWRSKYIERRKSYTTREFIQRWSRKLFNTLNEELNKGMHAISEMSIMETVLFNNLSYQLLEKRHIGYKFLWCASVSKQEWRIINQNSSLKNRLFHPLKF